MERYIKDILKWMKANHVTNLQSRKRRRELMGKGTQTYKTVQGAYQILDKKTE